MWTKQTDVHFKIRSVSDPSTKLRVALSLSKGDSPLPTRSAAWDRDEWDIAMDDGTVYRLCVEREVGQWFLEGVFD